jgi:hypothetical protein
MNERETSRKPAGRGLPRLPANVRVWIRSLHRDAGYLVVGLTFVYALSGLAVNHIADWDPNFTQTKREFHVDLPAGADDDAIANVVLERAEIRETPLSVYRVSPERLEVTLAQTSLFIGSDGHVLQSG